MIGHSNGFGFLACDEGGDDLLLGRRDMETLFDGDRIRVRLSGKDRRGRDKARLIDVIKRYTDQVVGQLHNDKEGYFIVPRNKRNTHKIDVDNSQLLGAKVGQYVVVTIMDYPCHQYLAFGKVKEVLGDVNAPGMEIEVAIREHDISHIWPASVEKTAASLGKNVLAPDTLYRVDLRRLPFITIDGDDAKDFDAAVYCEPNGRGWRLWVAIAGVSHYVSPESDLDIEAQKRCTSVYFPGHVVPMLPESLSNGLCSLNPHVDRLVIACEMQINKAGKLTGYEFSEAVIHSNARLTYTQVNALINKPESTLGKSVKHDHAHLVSHIFELQSMYGALKKARDKRGSIDFETQEVSFQFNKARKVERINRIERNDAHKLIEECMLCANVATARFLNRLDLPV